ncbi:MAG: hypothetical protein J5995_00060, partial [Muribaculaceae bacterium]|nr:hypothetical protein [Muribaculaceae bacterium]
AEGSRYILAPFPSGERERDASFGMICAHYAANFRRINFSSNAKLLKKNGTLPYPTMFFFIWQFILMTKCVL